MKAALIMRQTPGGVLIFGFSPTTEFEDGDDRLTTSEIEYDVVAKEWTPCPGNDPNDMLTKGALASLKNWGTCYKKYPYKDIYPDRLGEKGIAAWERFIEIKTLIRRATDQEEKERLLEEYMRIGNAYNFPGK